MKLSLAATILCLVGNVPSNDAQSDPGFCYDSKGKLKGKSGPLLDADFAPTGKKEDPIRSRLDRRGEPGCPCSYVSHTALSKHEMYVCVILASFTTLRRLCSNF